MDLSVITVTHHSKEFIEDQVFSLMMSCFSVQFEHIIVDNASQDGTADFIEGRFGRHITLVRNPENVGFSRANNQALQLAKGRYLLFLNPDMCIKEGDLDGFVRWMDAHPDVGVAGCRLLNPAGEAVKDMQPGHFPTWKESVLWLLRLDGLLKRSLKELGDEPEDVESLKGAFLLVRRELVDKLGWAFDPRYFLLFEDTDLCREAHRLGYRTVYYPDLACLDYLSRSFSIKPSLWIYNEFTQSMLQYYQKWHPGRQAFWIKALMPIGRLLRFGFWT